MNFREMSYITAIAKYQNITKAAEALHISQPGLSKFLSNLENELGLKLFDRADKKYIPTYAGQRYLEYSHKITDMKSSLDAELSDIIKRNIGVLNIGLPNMRCAFMLPKTLPVFSRKYPNVKVNIFEGTSAVIDVKLLEGDIDLAFRYDKYVQSYTKFIQFILWHSCDMPSCFIEPDFAKCYFRLVQLSAGLNSLVALGT